MRDRSPDFRTPAVLIAVIIGFGISAGATAEESASARAESDSSSARIPVQLRSVDFGLGAGLKVGADFYLTPLQTVGVDAYHLQLPIPCEATCHRRTEVQLKWMASTTAKLVQGGLEAGLAGGRVLRDQSDRRSDGHVIGVVTGVRGSFTPLESVGLGLEANARPSIFFGTGGRYGEDDPYDDRLVEPRLGVSFALFIEFGSLRAPTWH